MMRKSIGWLIAYAAMLFLLLGAAARASEEDVPLDKVPKPILEAVKGRFNVAELIAAAKELENDKLVYEVSIKHQGQNIDVTLTPEGDILLIEKEIAAKDLPQAVAQALKEKYPHATYKIIEEIIKREKQQEKLEYYEILLVTADKQTLEVQVTAAGKIVNEEKKSEKDAQ